MGTLIRCNDATFTNNVGIGAYPIISALKGLYVLKGTENDSIADETDNNNNLDLVGSATFETKDVSITGGMTTNYFNSPIQDNDTIAFIALYNPSSGDRCLFSTMNTGQLKGFFLSNKIVILRADGSFKSANLSGISTSTSWYIVGAIVSSSSCKVYKFNGASASEIASISFSSYAKNTLPVSIGGSPYTYGSYEGTMKYAMAAIYSGAVSVDELTAGMKYMYDYAKKYNLAV